MKYLGIDYGTKRIGVAVSDDTGTLAFPLTTVDAGRGALLAIVEIADSEKAEKIVIGESRNYKNEPNDVMEDIERFKKDFAESSGIPVEYELEFMTSAQALRQGQDKRGGGGVLGESLDASAAALILQSYLDRNRKTS